MTESADTLIRRLALQPHPEGGYYRETYRAAGAVTRADGKRLAASTAIYYLLCDGAWSTWHRIRADELWHFHAGTPLHVHVLAPDGGYRRLRLGNALADEGAEFQGVVPGGAAGSPPSSPNRAATRWRAARWRRGSNSASSSWPTPANCAACIPRRPS